VASRSDLGHHPDRSRPPGVALSTYFRSSNLIELSFDDRPVKIRSRQTDNPSASISFGVGENVLSRSDLGLHLRENPFEHRRILPGCRDRIAPDVSASSSTLTMATAIHVARV
jgi:hypothetical protein